MTGISQKSAVGKTSQELGMPASNVRLQERALRQVLKTATPLTVHFTYPSVRGMIDQEVRLVPEFAAKGVSSILMIAQDITDRKRIQELAERSERDIRSLTASLMTAQEQERRRVARDLHDSMGQLLSALAAEIGSTLDLDLPGSARQRLQAARESALRIVEEARRIARQLHPAIVEDLGLPKSLQSLCDEFSQRTEIPVVFSVRGLSSPIPIEVAACAYRIAQQALNNVECHACAKHASVHLFMGRGLHLSIRDDGIGFDRPRRFGAPRRSPR
jgi:signal transduction histidine kinase